MKHDEKRALIESYLNAYNTFDIDGMLAVIHSEIEFKNISGGEVDASASGAGGVRGLAERSKELFFWRRQTMSTFRTRDDQAFIDVAYEDVLSSDLPNGMKKGETLRLEGRSEFTFRDGKISRITDIS